SATNAFTRGSTDGRSPVFVQPFRSALANALANRDSAPASHSASTALPAPTALASHPSFPAASVPDALILADTHFAPSREAPKPSPSPPEGPPPATASTNASTIAPIAPASPLVPQPPLLSTRSKAAASFACFLARHVPSTPAPFASALA